MRLIVISWLETFEGEVETINALFCAGMEILHLRKPGMGAEALGRLIEGIDERYWGRLTVHYLPEVAERYGVGGYHLSAGRPGAPMGWSGRVSVSCHSVEELRSVRGSVDYAFLSPIYDSISKHGYRAGFTTEELDKARKEGVLDENVVALGGITVDRVGECRDMGFGGVAVLGGVWEGGGGVDGVVGRWREYKEKCAKDDN